MPKRARTGSEIKVVRILSGSDSRTARIAVANLTTMMASVIQTACKLAARSGPSSLTESLC
jgi:hypothetical protein